MVYKSTDQKTLRAGFISFMLKEGKAKNTASSNAFCVFSLWNKCGQDFFWDTINADDASLRATILPFLEKYYLNQGKTALPGYLSSIRHFKRYLANSAAGEVHLKNDIISHNNTNISTKQAPILAINLLREMNITSSDRNVIIYSAARAYLESIKPQTVDLDKYYLGDSRDYTSLTDIYIQFLRSSQNYQQMPNVIRFDARKGQIASLTYNFDYSRIKSVNPEDLYQALRKEFNVGGENNNHNSWLKWSRSTVDAAKFISEFSDVNDFEEFVSRAY